MSPDHEQRTLDVSGLPLEEQVKIAEEALRTILTTPRRALRELAKEPEFREMMREIIRRLDASLRDREDSYEKCLRPNCGHGKYWHNTTGECAVGVGEVGPVCHCDKFVDADEAAALLKLAQNGLREIVESTGFRAKPLRQQALGLLIRLEREG